MRYVKTVTFVLAVALLALASRSARADEFDELMVFTFSGPVEVPGFVLPAGTYRFRLANPDTERNILQILSEDRSQVYATLLTIPVQRTTVTYKPVVTFEDRAAGSPEAIRAIFYPGETTGMKLEYPPDRTNGEASVVPTNQR